jgi:hypothetical protein
VRTEFVKDWKLAGTVGVDAGLLWLGDPCYCVTPDCDSHPAKTWTEFCEHLGKIEKDGVAQWGFVPGGDGLGVSVSTGYGDGEYPVYVKRTRGGRVAEVRVVFIGDEADEVMSDDDEDERCEANVGG